MGIKIKKKDLIHCIPYLLSIAFFFVLHFSKDLLFTENLYYDLFGRKNWILKGLSFFSLLIYSSFSLYKVYKLEKDMTNPVVEPLQFNWLKSIIGLMIIIILYHGLSGLLNEPSGYFPLFFLPSIRGYDILIFTILFSLFGVRHSMVHSAWLLDQGFLSQSLKKKKYEKSGLEIEKLKDYVHAVKDYMEVRKPYLANEFSLDDLADYLDIPRAHITQALNEVLETNFYHFVNEYRIREFISVLESSGEEKPNFLSLALGVGFNSKSTFNDSFKRITGSTPSLYFVEKKRKNRS
ncbi:helix-turn-helix domain-containing protein [Leptospira sp. 'Mane']|uniref:helix-turn-helix domain-containing protein n=1 Tax=Leptospira sp. 'Mane' TaxID=3387407 RepID=UPI00398B59F8